jgi:hypothetical protein
MRANLNRSFDFFLNAFHSRFRKFRVIDQKFCNDRARDLEKRLLPMKIQPIILYQFFRIKTTVFNMKIFQKLKTFICRNESSQLKFLAAHQKVRCFYNFIKGKITVHSLLRIFQEASNAK